MSCGRLRLHAHVQGHHQGSNVSLRGLRGHLFDSVSFLVLKFCRKFCHLLFCLANWRRHIVGARWRESWIHSLVPLWDHK